MNHIVNQKDDLNDPNDFNYLNDLNERNDPNVLRRKPEKKVTMTQEFDARKSYMAIKANEKMIARSHRQC